MGPDIRRFFYTFFFIGFAWACFNQVGGSSIFVLTCMFGMIFSKMLEDGTVI